MDSVVLDVIDRVRRVPQDGDNAGHGSVYDVLYFLTCQSRRHVSTTWSRMIARMPDWQHLPKHRFNGKRPTPVAEISRLQELARSLYHKFQMRASRPRSALQHVYAVTSPLFSAIKIGMWTGTVKALHSRYKGQYGHDLQLATFETTNARLAEDMSFCALEDLHITHELYEKQWSEVCDVLRTMAARFPVSET